MTEPATCTATASKDGQAYRCGLPDGHSGDWGHWDPATGSTWNVIVMLTPVPA